jgi:hypothetical protein
MYIYIYHIYNRSKSFILEKKISRGLGSLPPALAREVETGLWCGENTWCKPPICLVQQRPASCVCNVKICVFYAKCII